MMSIIIRINRGDIVGYVLGNPFGYFCSATLNTNNFRLGLRKVGHSEHRWEIINKQLNLL